MKDIKERFEDKYTPEPNSGCWLWNTTTNNGGYGIVKHKGKVIGAHRLSYELYCEEIPESMVVCHKCDTRSCVNPEHLFIGTYKDNTQDMITKGRKRNGDRSKLMMGNDRSVGVKNCSAKLTEQQVIDIFLDNRKAKQIAGEYSIHVNTVYKIKNRIRWKHLTKDL